MIIQVEILNKSTNELGNIIYNINKSKTFIVSTEKNSTTIQEAKDKLDELKSSLNMTQKIRVLEYHNDESDETRQPCKVLFEG